ncbi:MAG: hypothetical protein ABSB89_09045 [Candidatus Bathyarchaeia archaeon]|jgi:hypothetical protein
MDEENENQEDSEQEENSEDEIDQQEQQNQEVSFEKQVDDYCKALEKTHGIEYANQVRKRYATAKEFKLFLDAEAFEGYWRKLVIDFLQKREKENEELHNNVLARLNDIDSRDYELHQKTLEMLERIEERDRAFNDKIMAGLEKDDKEDAEFQKKLNEIADLKLERERKKKALA